MRKLHCPFCDNPIEDLPQAICNNHPNKVYILRHIYGKDVFGVRINVKNSISYIDIFDKRYEWIYN